MVDPLSCSGPSVGPDLVERHAESLGYRLLSGDVPMMERVNAGAGVQATSAGEPDKGVTLLCQARSDRLNRPAGHRLSFLVAAPFQRGRDPNELLNCDCYREELSI